MKFTKKASLVILLFSATLCKNATAVKLHCNSDISMNNIVNKFYDASVLKDIFLAQSRFDQTKSEEAKVEILAKLLNRYQSAHENFVFVKASHTTKELIQFFNQEYTPCDSQRALAADILLPYAFCNLVVERLFQEKANVLLGEYILDVHQWFEEMRSVEYEALLIPNNLSNG